jgi:hypothetical protein
MDPITGAMIGSALSALIGGLFSGGGSSASGTSGLTPYQQALLNKVMETQGKRTIYQNPLYEMATNLSMALMPRSARTTGYLQTPNDPFVVNEPDDFVRERPGRSADAAPQTGSPLNGLTGGFTGGGGGSNTRTAAAIQALAANGFGSGSLTSPTRTGTRGITVNTPAQLLSRDRLMQR